MTDVCVVGGGGHVGLPLALAFAGEGLRTVSYDINPATVALVASGVMPFWEEGAEPVLRKVLADGSFSITTDPSAVADADAVVVVVGTPVDEHLNPDPDVVRDAVRDLVPHLRAGQLLVLRSTVFPGVTRQVKAMLDVQRPGVLVAFCPERIAQGKALTELATLPQIIGADDEQTASRARALFATLTDSLVAATPEEAELAKLFTNVWRYIKFAAANQFFMMANEAGVDFERVRATLTQDYPRAADMPGPGFAAGPCLLKDTMQLAAFDDNNFTLGHSAMLVNEGLPLYLVSRMADRFGLADKTVGILGMSFKAGTDDVRSSLAFKLRKILQFRAKEVLATDPRASDSRLLPLDEVLRRSDLLVIGAPHSEYRTLVVEQPVVDVWNLRGGGVLL